MTARADRALVMAHSAGGLTDRDRRTLERTFSDFARFDFPMRGDLTSHLSSTALVVVAGGDGTVGHVARALAGTQRRMAVLPLGTYNNFARGLRIPRTLRAAVEVALHGRVRRVTLGRVNGRWFLESAGLGLFGAAIRAGDALKDLEFGALTKRLREVTGAEQFHFEVRGDVSADGYARSLIFANTPTTGNRIRIGSSRPTDAFLDLTFGIAETRRSVVGRAVRSALSDDAAPPDGISLCIRRVHVVARPRVAIVADNKTAGRTPCTVEAVSGALRVMLPA